MSKLYIVSTPIGNLKDITLRALEVLETVNFIACEDTRVTGFLLSHYNIKKELISVNAQSESNKISHIVNKINAGSTCALVSDAGTPAISDPGARLISKCIEENIQIEPVPGVTAVITALTVSGLPTDSFIYDGFLPQKKGRQKQLQSYLTEKRTVIIYESPYRIEKLIDELNNYMPDRLIVVCRELTKKFEEIWRGTASEIKASIKDRNIKGEFVVILAPCDWK